MTHPHRYAIPTVLAGLAFFAGCAGGPNAASPQNPAKHAAANMEKFVVLGPANGLAVACTDLQERVLPDGRLEVAANLNNREDRAEKLQADCVFTDTDGLGIGDETAFQTIALPAGATQTVSFTSRDMKARRYTIRVRPAS